MNTLATLFIATTSTIAIATAQQSHPRRGFDYHSSILVLTAYSINDNRPCTFFHEHGTSSVGASLECVLNSSYILLSLGMFGIITGNQSRSLKGF